MAKPRSGKIRKTGNAPDPGSSGDDDDEGQGSSGLAIVATCDEDPQNKTGECF